MAERSEALKKAQQKYMERFSVARVRMDHAQYECVQTHAEAQGQSVNGFINRAITEAIERDSGGIVLERAETALEQTQGTGVVSLPSEAIRTAREAAEAAGEAMPQFIARAVETQAKRDITSRRMGVNPATGGKLEKEA